jgi:hypothetical protein
MNHLTAIDRDALERAIQLCRSESPRRAQQIDAQFSRGQSWAEIAKTCAFRLQLDALRCTPWQFPVCHYDADDLEWASREPHDNPSGHRAAVELLQRLLAAGLSKYEPDPIAALERAEAKRRTA